jgi:hypothetical protein
MIHKLALFEDEQARTVRKISFKDTINQITGTYLMTTTRSSRFSMLSALTSEESSRIDEAFHCMKEKCNWSSVINSAVALESRLFKILNRKSKRTLVSIRPDLIFTLGNLADAYLNNKQKFGNCIPNRHEHLLKLVNSFRIVSAHPKQYEVDKNTTEAVFNLTLNFLLDQECMPLRKPGPKKKP